MVIVVVSIIELQLVGLERKLEGIKNMSIPLTPQADEAWQLIRKTLFEVNRQFVRMRAKIVAGTINSSDILDGLWSALPQWKQRIDDALIDVSGSALQDHVRTVTGEPTLDLIGDWVNLKLAVQILIDTIRSDPNLFVQSGLNIGKEADTIEDVNGERRSVVYSAGEMDYLIPLIDDCLTFLG